MKRVALVGATLACASGVALASGGSRQGVTISVYPSIAPLFEPVVLSGRADTASAGELVTVEGQECGVPGGVFRGVAAAQTVEGGAWSVEYRPRTTTVLRASFGNDVSREVTVLRRAFLTFVPRPGKKYRITLFGVGRLSAKRVRIERFDTKNRAWRAQRTVKLKSGYGEYAEATVRLRVPKGTTLRAVLPSSEAKPCYLSGYSKPIRT